MVESFVKSRRGILEHLQQTRITSRQFAVFQLALLLADKATGVWWGDSVAVTSYFRDLNVKAAKAALAELESKGYIKRFRQPGSRSSYPILVNKYEVTVGGLKGTRVVAEQTVDWRRPVTELRTEAGTETRTEATPEAGREGRPPYSRPETSRLVRPETTTVNSAGSPVAVARNASHVSQAKPTATPKTPTEIREEVARHIDLTMEERNNATRSGERKGMLPDELTAADRLAQIFAELSGRETSSDAFVVFLYNCPFGRTDQYSLPKIAAVLRWAFEKSDFWSNRIGSAESFCARFDAIAVQYDRFYAKAGFKPHEIDCSFLDGLIPEEDEDFPLCGMCAVNRTSPAPPDASEPATNGEGYYLNCDECDPPSVIPPPPRGLIARARAKNISGPTEFDGSMFRVEDIDDSDGLS